MKDAFAENIAGAVSLVNDDTNKVGASIDIVEGVDSQYIDILELPMSDEELLSLKEEYESASNGYYPKIKARQQRNKIYLKGLQNNSNQQDDRPIPKNLLFESTATFVPAALAKQPEPVVFSDNTPEGKKASNDLKTMLQYHSNVLGIRQKLGVMVWQWGEYFIGCVKHGWNPIIDPVTGEDSGDITTELRRPQNLILDPDGYVNEFGDFVGWLGERITKSAQWFIDKYPKHKEYITEQVSGKLGTKITATEWWTDDFCFTTYKDVVLDKHKNEFFNYAEAPEEDEEGLIIPSQPVYNHFAKPKKPYTFFSVFSLQEEPYDFTNLIEQNIANQDSIFARDVQISKNLASANNSIAISGTSFTVETADQAVQTFFEEGFLLIPDGKMDGVRRIPASPLPQGTMEAQMSDMASLRSIYGTSGLVPSNDPNEAVRNNILDTNHDSSRIGGGVGERLEVAAQNIYNWWAQLYAVFYDTPHYGAVMGTASAVDYVRITSSNLERRFVISVAPNSMKPKDETAEMNQAIELAKLGFLDPINLYKALNDPDPLNTAKMATMFRVDPAMYLATYFPQEMMGGGQVGTVPGNPLQTGMGSTGPPIDTMEEPSDLSISQPSSSLSQVQMPKL